EGQLTEEWVSCNLESKCRQWLFVGRLTGQDLLRILNVSAIGLAEIQWGRQEVNDCVEQWLDALVLVGGATVNRVDLRVNNHLTDSCLDLSDAELFATEVLLHELFVGLCNGLEKLLTVLSCAVCELCWDLLNGSFGTNWGNSTPGQCLHFKKVDDAVEVVLSTDWELHNQWLCTQAVLDGANGEVEVSTELVHLVHEADTWNVVLGSLTPNLLGLWLN